MTRYWGQLVVALSVALAAGYWLSSDGHTLLTAATAGVIVYFTVRWFLAVLFRTRYWLSTDGHRSRNCPNCGQYIYRKSGDWVLRCYRCGWRRGLPGLRYIFHSVPVRQLKRTVLGPSLIVVVVALAAVLFGATGQIAMSDISIPDENNSETGPADTDPGDTAETGPADADLDDTSETGTQPEDGDQTINETAVEQQVFELVNEERRTRGLAPLTWHDRAYQAAKEHAVDMGTRDYYNHTSLDGETQQQRYAFCRGGENIDKTRVHQPISVWHTENRIVEYTNADELAQGLFQSWMNSPPHRERGIRGDWIAGAAAIHITDEDEVLAVFGFCST